MSPYTTRDSNLFGEQVSLVANWNARFLAGMPTGMSALPEDNFATKVKYTHLPGQPNLWLIIWLGFGLRMQHLTRQPLWGDEGWSFYFAAQSWSQLLALTAIDIHPPFYYLLLKSWLAISGEMPVTARFLSVIAGTLLIPLSYLIGKRFFERRVGLIAAGLTAVMPLAIYYSHEVRMYGWVTLWMAISLYSLSRLLPQPGFNKWATLYIISTTAALYTMYYAAFVIIGQVIVWLYWGWHRQAALKIPATLLMIVGGLYLPWLLYAGPRLLNYIANKRAVEGYHALSLSQFLSDHAVAFSLGHLPPAWSHYAGAALPFVVLAIFGLIILLRGYGRYHLLLSLHLITPLGLGYLVNQIFPFNPPTYERTLLIAAPVYWLLIAVGLKPLISRRWLARPSLNSLLMALILSPGLLIITVSLLNFYRLPRHQQEDYRPLLADIAARATPADSLIASYQWQFGFYRAYLPPPRPNIFIVPQWGQGWDADSNGQRPQMNQDLSQLLAQSPRLWFPAHQAAGHIWEDAAEAALSRLGYPTQLTWHGPRTKLILTAGQTAELTATLTANFDNRLQLMMAQVGQGSYQAGRGIIPVQLNWHKTDHLGQAHRVTLRLVDQAGRTWSSRDSLPQAGQRRFTELAIGESFIDRHGLLIAAGTPAGTYRLLLSVRRVTDAHPLDLLTETGQPMGAELLLREVTVIDPSPPVGPTALTVQTSLKAQISQTAHLIGYTLPGGPFKAGQNMPLTLFWQAGTDRSTPFEVQVELVNSAGEAVTSYQRPPLRPVDHWSPGLLLRDPHDLPLPPTLPPGQYDLRLSLVTADNRRLPIYPANQSRLSRLWSAAETLNLTTVTTIDRPHNFEPPELPISLTVNFNDQAQLIGIDLPQPTVAPGDSLPVTLYWQATQPFDRSWTVFVHLIDDAGQIVSQQDQLPGGGQFPTTSWLPGEYLTDPYQLTIPPDIPPDSYYLRIGLYDANDFSRLPVVQDGQIINDHVVLETWPVVVMPATTGP